MGSEQRLPVESASVPGWVHGPGLARPVPARSLRGALWRLRVAAAPCASAGRGAEAVQTQRLPARPLGLAGDSLAAVSR